MDAIEQSLEGQSLYGDDFDEAQLAEWYADEKEAYAALGAEDFESYSYGYHALNRIHGFRHLPKVSFGRVLCFGGAYGEELQPIASRIASITIAEPSRAFARDSVHGVPTNYLRPNPAGRIPVSDGWFDLITCLGVLHHIPNVSFVVGELSRVLKAGGHLLLREPIVSMGDWRQPRRGLTKRERGIPLLLLERIVLGAGLQTARRTLCAFPLTKRLFGVFRVEVYNSPLAVWLDAGLCSAFAWNVNYHPRHVIQRLRPTSVFLVLVKPAA